MEFCNKGMVWVWSKTIFLHFFGTLPLVKDYVKTAETSSDTDKLAPVEVSKESSPRKFGPKLQETEGQSLSPRDSRQFLCLSRGLTGDVLHCDDWHPKSWWRLCGAGGGGPAVPRSAGQLLLPGCLRVSRPQQCQCLPGWRCRVATSSSLTHGKLTLGVQTVLVFSAVSLAEVYISTLQLFGLFSSMIFPAVETTVFSAGEGGGQAARLWQGGLAETFTSQRSTSSASGVLRLPAEYFVCQRSTSSASVVLCLSA